MEEASAERDTKREDGWIVRGVDGLKGIRGRRLEKMNSNEALRCRQVLFYRQLRKFCKNLVSVDKVQAQTSINF